MWTTSLSRAVSNAALCLPEPPVDSITNPIFVITAWHLRGTAVLGTKSLLGTSKGQFARETRPVVQVVQTPQHLASELPDVQLGQNMTLTRELEPRTDEHGRQSAAPECPPRCIVNQSTSPL